MSPTSRVPHWLQLAITIATICILAVLTAQSNGQLALPSIVISALSIVKLCLGVFSDSLGRVNANREAQKFAKSQTLSKPPSSQAGFVTVRALAAVLLGLPGVAILFLALGTGATCSPQQANAIAVEVAVLACQEVQSVLPANSPAAQYVALVCSDIDAQGNTLHSSHTVYVSSASWNAAKVEFLKTHASLPGGMSPPH